MKRLLQQTKYLAIAAVALVPLASNVNAETFIRANAYFINPISDDVLDNEFAGGLAFGETFADDNLGSWQIELESYYSRFDEKLKNESLDDGKFKSTQIPILLGVKRNFHLSNPNIVLWIGPAVGVNIVKNKISGDISGSGYSKDETKTWFAASIGVGASFRFNDSILINAGYRFFFSDRTSIDEKTLKREEMMANTFDLGIQYFF